MKNRFIGDGIKNRIFIKKVFYIALHSTDSCHWRHDNKVGASSGNGVKGDKPLHGVVMIRFRGIYVRR